jgi:hypothetical protein
VFASVLLGTSFAPHLRAQEGTPLAPSVSDEASTRPEAVIPVRTPATTSIWSVGGIDFSGLVDGYYNFNANHPPTSSDGNQMHNFDYNANAFSLNMAKLTMSHDPTPVGFRIDLGFGKAFNKILASEPNFKHLEQAYVSWKPTQGKGFEADFGEFVTSAGAEVIETKDNWNYSRSLLFVLAIPTYHVGLRTSMPVTKAFTAGVQIVNGWNNFTDNNSGKTVGLTGCYVKTKYGWSGNYYVGPENNGTNVGKRNLFDTVLSLTPTSRLSAYINYDYGQNRDAVSLSKTTFVTGSLERWQGIAGALHYQATSTISFTPRLEYYRDETGFMTGTKQNLNEFTLTGEYKIPEGALVRLEYRRDDSDQPYFVKGTRLVHAQSTLEVGVVAFFGPKH